jgi:hypothetical protein
MSFLHQLNDRPGRWVRACAVLLVAGFSLAGGRAAQAPSAPAVRPLPSIKLSSAKLVKFPGGYNSNRKAAFLADSKCPSHWDGNTLYVFNSWEQPWRATGPDLFHLSKAVPSRFNAEGLTKLFIWIESTYRDDDGTVYAWVHNEVPDECPPRKDAIAGYPIVVRIGALKSKDNGMTWNHLGFVFEPSPTTISCDTEDIWYAGGEGDFDVFLDSKKEYFYFFFTNYSSIPVEQGLCVGRMKYADRNDPRGKVSVWHEGEWNESALGGHATPIFPATVDLKRKDGQTFWGPAIHWNTYLNQYVMVLNRVKDTSWATEGIYISFSNDLADPKGWSVPQKIMDREEATHADPGHVGNGWYGQVMGTGQGETDKLAGRVARLFVDGQSRWEIQFLKPGEK